MSVNLTGIHRHFAWGLTLLLALYGQPSISEEISALDRQGNEISIEVLPAEGDLLVIWLVDHEEQRPQFEQMLGAFRQQGMEVWRVDLLSDYFLPRSKENIRTLSGEGVAAVIDAAHRFRNKPILLAAYERMPLPLLRGVRLWQTRHRGDSRLAGGVLFYPNLFGPSPVAGEAPQPDPIVSATNIPLVIYQPQEGSHRWRLHRILEEFWSRGTPVWAYLVPQVRDWFFMHEPGEYPMESAATGAVPGNLRHLARLMERVPKPEAPLSLEGASSTGDRQVTGLTAFSRLRPAPELSLSDWEGRSFSLKQYRGAVTLVNFWATWCPPCVDEVPSLNKLAERYADRPFKVISVDFRETGETVYNFTQKIPVDFPILMDTDGRVSLDWKVFSFPSSFILDREGRIRYSVNRAIDWNTPEVWSLIETLIDDIPPGTVEGHSGPSQQADVSEDSIQRMN